MLISVIRALASLQLSIAIYVVLHGVAFAQQPRFSEVVTVFIPGIYGSTLSDSDGEVFWGHNGIGRKGLSLLEHPNLSPALFSDVRFEVGVFGQTVRGYSGIDRTTRHLASEARTFAYDWRYSNKKTAAKLEEFICNDSTIIDPKMRVVFIAHSMGGLVLRHWINDFLTNDTGTTSCISPNKIESFVFAATPHLGSMEPIRTLLNGKTTLDTSPLVSALFTGRMAQYGITFESSYELLPSHNIAGRACPAYNDQQAHNFSKDIGTGIRLPINLSSINDWEILSIPKDTVGFSTRADLNALIQQRVRSASIVVCDLLEHKYSNAISRKMNFIVGELHNRNGTGMAETTLHSVLLEVDPEGETSLSFSMGKGDGTVPSWSSEPRALNIAHIADYPQTANRAHESVLDDVRIRTHIQRVLDNAAQNVAWLNIEDIQTIVADREDWDKLLRSFAQLPTDSLQPEVYKAGIEYLANKADELGILGFDLAYAATRYASEKNAPMAALNFALAGEAAAGIDDISRIFAKQQAAIIFNANGNPALASELALSSGKSLSEFVGGASDLETFELRAPAETLENGWRDIINSQDVRAFDPNLSDIVRESPRFDTRVFEDQMLQDYQLLQ